MGPLIAIELFKIFRKPRTYIAFAAIATIVSLIQLALYADGAAYLDFMLQPLKDTFEVGGNVLNGYQVCYLILQTLLVHVPLLIALVAGDIIAGEANTGTLRLIATKPVSRTRLLAGKFTATVIYTVLLLLFMAVLALGVSVLLFGTSDMMVLRSDGILIINQHDVLWRYGGAFGFAVLAMLTVASLAFCLSAFADNSIGPIIATMSVIILLTILTTMDIPLFNRLKPYLFTNHMLNWKGFFEDPVDRGEVLKSASVLLGHIVFFVLVTVTAFRRKDILS
ncbi:MAG TPA: ABC transporter permease [Chitinophagaceae bacterium]|jgi:ABC-2 type transport system permease protein|nr:ABC transporter permease [Chitinophagaceae bacterium]